MGSHGGGCEPSHASVGTRRKPFAVIFGEREQTRRVALLSSGQVERLSTTATTTTAAGGKAHPLAVRSMGYRLSSCPLSHLVDQSYYHEKTRGRLPSGSGSGSVAGGSARGGGGGGGLSPEAYNYGRWREDRDSSLQVIWRSPLMYCVKRL